MKKLLVVVAVLLVAWLGFNFMKTGKLSLLPAAESPESAQLRALESELRAIEQIESAGRAAGVTGIDTTSDVGALAARKEELERKIAALKAGAHQVRRGKPRRPVAPSPFRRDRARRPGTPPGRRTRTPGSTGRGSAA